MLIRPYDHDATSITIDAAQVENVPPADGVGTEHLLIVAQPMPPFCGQKQRRHGFEIESPVRLLENRPYVDHPVDISSRRRISSHRRLRRSGEEVAEGAYAGRRLGGLSPLAEGEQAPAAVGLHHMS